MILAAPLVIPFAKAVGLSVGTLGMAALSDQVNDYIQDNPEESMKILSTIIPGAGIGQIFMSKEDKISLEDLDEMTDEEAQDLSKEEKAELMKQAGKSGSKDKRQTMIDLSEKLGLSGEGKEKQDIEYEVDERYDEGGVEEVSKPKFDYKKFFRKRRSNGGPLNDDEEYQQSELSKRVNKLMDDGFDFGEAVKEAMKEGYKDGGSIGIEVLFGPKRQNLFMGGPALTGAPLAIYNSMKAYDAFTDQEIADAIKEAGYDLPTSGSTTTPPDSTPGDSNQSGNENRNIAATTGIGGIGYSPEQNVAEFQAYKDRINAEAMGSPFTSGPMVDSLNDKIVDQMRSQNPNLQSRTNAEIIASFPEMFNVGEVEDLNTFGKIKGSFNQGITSLMNSPVGKIAGFAINPALAAIRMLPQSKPVGRVDGRAIYGVGSFDKFGTNAANQTALNKTGNFTNFQLGISTDPGRVAGNPANNVFAGMNAQSAFGDISKGAQSRIDRISKTLEKQKKAGKVPSKTLTERKAKFEKQLADHNREKAKAEANQKAAKDNQAGYGGSCFIAGTKVTMADGTFKNIEDVKVGDKVKGHKEENTVIKLDPTLLADRKLYSFNDNEHYFFTSEHPFMTEEGWKSIKPEKTKERDGVELYDQLKGELKVGDKLVTDNGSIKVTDIKSKEMNNPEMPLYNFNVSNDNSYIADNYVVHNKGCFLKGTLITMADGTTKPVEQVDLGDEVAVGGKVFAVGRFLNTELYDYKGIKVSGSHMVNEDGTWMRVRDTKHGKSLGNDENTVYVFGSENRRILINNILFTDYFEIEDQEQLLKEENKFFDNWKTFANNEDIKNVNTLNAS
jgi:hypothetical protein